jgi:hypothetical protein
MGAGVNGVPCHLVVLLAEEELKITLGFATIQNHLTEELLVLDQAQKLFLVMHSSVPLVKENHT